MTTFYFLILIEKNEIIVAEWLKYLLTSQSVN